MEYDVYAMHLVAPKVFQVSWGAPGAPLFGHQPTAISGGQNHPIYFVVWVETWVEKDGQEKTLSKSIT